MLRAALPVHVFCGVGGKIAFLQAHASLKPLTRKPLAAVVDFALAWRHRGEPSTDDFDRTADDKPKIAVGAPAVDGE